MPPIMNLSIRMERVLLSPLIQYDAIPHFRVLLRYSINSCESAGNELLGAYPLPYRRERRHGPEPVHEPRQRREKIVHLFFGVFRAHGDSQAAVAEAADFP